MASRLGRDCHACFLIFLQVSRWLKHEWKHPGFLGNKQSLLKLKAKIYDFPHIWIRIILFHE